MRLVEILAREMDEWPDGAAVAVQDLDRQVCFNLAANGIVFGSAEWSDLLARGLWCHSVRMASLATDYATAIVTREMWEAERAKLNCAAEWNGDGLPPVGAVCECCWESAASEYRRVNIIAHDNGKAVYRWLDGEKEGLLCEEEQYILSNGIPNFRPIRTPEQVAADNREKDIIEMKEVFLRGASGIWKGARLGIEALYDAGYRKQEKDQ